jgi:hypothetical protein
MLVVNLPQQEHFSFALVPSSQNLHSSHVAGGYLNSVMIMTCGSSWILLPFAKILKGFDRGSHQSNDQKNKNKTKIGAQDFDNERKISTMSE